MKQAVKPDQNNPEAKKTQVTHMFNGISKSYDLLNRIITLGIDTLWRKRLIELVKKERHELVLDIATGTGDLVLALAKLDTEKIIGLDLSPGMLEIGKQKVKAKGLENRIDMQLGDSEALPYQSAYFDVVTIAFGVRNFEHLEKGLEEILRVLKPKGTLVILETAVPKNKIFKAFYLFYTQQIMPFIGKLFSKDRSAYQYLSDSAAAFPCGKDFNNILEKIGFIEVVDDPQTLGVATIYSATKP